MKSTMKSKQGWVAVIEACLAIVVLFTFLMLAINQQPQKQEDVYKNFGKAILYQVENNDTFRSLVLVNDTVHVNESIFALASSYNFNSEACITVLGDSCSITSSPPNKEIISYDFFVVANETLNSGNKLKVFVWEK